MPPRLTLRIPRAADAAEYIALNRISRRFHAGRATPPRDPAAFRALLRRTSDPQYRCWLIVRRSDSVILGAVALSQIVHGKFRSAYLGYHIGAPFARQGYMHEALTDAVTRAFRHLRLHRLEANIQPGNTPSLRLVRRLGFRREGYSPRYLKIGGRWRDHERWALLADEWSPRSRAPRDRAASGTHRVRT